MTDQSENIKTPPQHTVPNKQPTKKKTLCRALCIISAVIFLPVFFIIAIISTETGTRALIQLSDKLLDSLSIGAVSGNLQQGLLINKLQFKNDAIHVDVEQAALQLDFTCLWQTTICVEQAVISAPLIHVDTTKLASSPQKNRQAVRMQRITLPISLQLKHMAVEQLTLTINQNKIHLDTFQSALNLDNKNGFVLLPTQIDGLRFVIQSETEPSTPDISNKPPIDWAGIEQRLTLPLLNGLASVILPFDIHIRDIQAKNWRYQYQRNEHMLQEIHITHLGLQAEAIDHHVKLHQLKVESSLADVQSEGQIELKQAFPLNLKVLADIHQQDNTLLPLSLPYSNAQLELSGELKNKTMLSLQTEGAVAAQLHGHVELNREKTPFQLELSAPSFTYPFNAKEGSLSPLQLKEVKLNLSGNLLDYQVQLSGEAKGMNIPQSRLNLLAHGGLSHAQIKSLQWYALNGTLSLQGDITWQDGLSWHSEAQLDKMNAGAYVKNWPAILSGKINSAGQISKQGWQVQVPVLDIHGSLAQRTLTLKGQLSTDHHTPLNIAQLQLHYGDNEISAQGQISSQSDFQMRINAPDLRGLLPELSASLTGNINLKGHIDEPNLNMELHGNKIRFQDLRLDKLFAKGRIGVAEQIEGRIDLDLSGFTYNDINIPHAMLWLTGRETNHQLHFRARGEPVAGEFHIYGNFDRTSQVWQGVLNQVKVKSPIGDLNNDKNINIGYDNKQIQATISPHCWHSTDVDLCFPQHFKAGKTGEVPFNIARINLDVINKLSGREGMLKGTLRSKGKTAWSGDKPLQLEIQIDGNDLTLAHKIDYRTFKLTLPKLFISSRLENNNLNLQSELILPQQGRLNTDLKLQDIAKGRKLGGSLNIHQLDLGLLNQLLSNGERVSGQLNTQLTFGGDLTSPLLNGSFNIHQIRAKMKSLPFELNNGDAQLHFHGNRSTLSARLQTAESSLHLDGDAAWKNLNRWETRLHAQTEQFKMDIPSMAKLKLNADVSMQATPELLELSGEIAIPWARIAVEALPESAVSVSSDEVILDDKTAQKLTALPTKMAAKTQSGAEIRSDLKIRIGDDVTVKAYGLNSHLQGLLSVRQEKGNLGLYGQINLKNGRYASFGQDLLIRKGQISFSGLPSQPLLNIEAIRNPETMENSNITAGLKVIGLAEQPSVEVFSEPSMPQDQALSYILTGRSLENSGEAGSSGSVGAALLGLGLGKSGKLVGGIGEAFGIQDLNLGTAGVGDSSKVVVSGNITPRLQIKYGVGLFDGLAEVTLRYKLIPQLYLQSVSGVNQAFDILYQFDF